MYDELYAAWRLETENSELSSLPPDFYERLAVYLQLINEENKLTDSNSLRATLISREMSNAKHMTQELIRTRYRKIMKMVIAGRSSATGSLTNQEQGLFNEVSPSALAYNRFASAILAGQRVNSNSETKELTVETPIKQRRAALRFLKPVPSIIGADMKSYGPFLPEDVSSVPLENAKILIKQGLAKPVELG